MKKLEHLQVGNLNINLILELQAPTFMRTKIDVVYSDLNNWDNEGLLYYSSHVKKGSQRKLSYIEYIWVKIIEELKKYNFNDEDIKSYRDELFQIYPIDQLQQLILNQIVSQNYSDEIIHSIKSKINKILSDAKVTILEIAIYESLINQIETNILFFKESKNVIAVNQNVIQTLQNQNSYEEYKLFLNETHLNLSLQPIINKFIERNSNLLDKKKTMILSEDEYRIITEIRKRIKEIKSLEIFYKHNGKIDRVDIKSMKAVKAESQLMAVIKSASYSKIEIQTQNGKIACVNHNEKIKF